MEKYLLLPILALLVPFTASAADISGFVRDAGNKPVPGVAVVYDCNGTKKDGKTNSYGRYRVRGLPDVTWCHVTVDNVKLTKRINSGSGSKEVNLRK